MHVVRNSWGYAATDEWAITDTHPNRQNREILSDLEATTREVIAAADAHVLGAIESVQWKRRGLLKRLIRADQSS
jgi:hypothetical protein